MNGRWYLVVGAVAMLLLMGALVGGIFSWGQVDREGETRGALAAGQPLSAVQRLQSAVGTELRTSREWVRAGGGATLTHGQVIYQVRALDGDGAELTARLALTDPTAARAVAGRAATVVAAAAARTDDSRTIFELAQAMVAGSDLSSVTVNSVELWVDDGRLIAQQRPVFDGPGGT